MLRRSLLSIALIVSAVSSAGGQSLAQLPRATVPTGMNDSTLVYVSDSAKRSRAAVAPDFRKMLSLRAFDSLVTANLRLTSTVNGSATWNSLQTFAGNQRVDSATGSARAQILTTARTIGGTSFNGSANIVPGLSDSATGANRAQILTTARTIGGTSFNGSANIIPGLSDSATGANRAQKLTTARTIGGTSFDGTANITPALSDSSTGSARAQILTTARTIGGTSFNGSANIVPGLADSATGATRAQKLTTARTIGGVSFDGTANILPDSAVGAARASALVGSPAITVSSCTGCGGGGATVTDTVRNVTFDTVRAGKVRTDSIIGNAASPALRIRSGIGASKYIQLQSTNAGSAVVNIAAVIDSQFRVQIPGRVTQPAIGLNNTGNTGIFGVGNDTIGFAFAGVQGLRIHAITNGASFQGASRVAFVAIDSQLQVPKGRFDKPGISFTNETDKGFYSGGTDTIVTSFGVSTEQIRLSRQGGQITIGTSTSAGIKLAPSGSSRTTAVYATDAGGSEIANVTATENGLRINVVGTAGQAAIGFNASANSGWRLGSNGSSDTLVTTSNGTDAHFLTNVRDSTPIRAVFTGDTIRTTSQIRATALPATGAGDVNVCWKTTGELSQGAACGTSSAKAKVGFGSIFNPVEKTMALRPTGYSYIPGMYGARHEYGLVADSTMAVDSTLVFRAESDQLLPNGQTIRKGEALNVNDRAVLALLTATVQELVKKTDRQGATIDSLRLELAKVKKP